MFSSKAFKKQEPSKLFFDNEVCKCNQLCSSEFLKEYSIILEDLLVHFFNQSYMRRLMPATYRYAKYEASGRTL